MKLLNSGKKLNEIVIMKFEEQFAIKLPNDYKEFMLENNGGIPEGEWVFDFVEIGDTNSTSSVVRNFLVIYDEETNNTDSLNKSYQILRNDGYLQPNIMPIGTDPGGDLICMSLSNESYGKIYFCNQELEDPDTGYMILSQIAVSFVDFLDGLYK